MLIVRNTSNKTVDFIRENVEVWFGDISSSLLILYINSMNEWSSGAFPYIFTVWTSTIDGYLIRNVEMTPIERSLKGHIVLIQNVRSNIIIESCVCYRMWSVF